MGRVEMAKVETLRPDPRNVNTHSETQLRQIVASIRDFGFNDPIGIDEDGNVVEGHGRLEAAIQLGLDSVPVIRLTFANDEDRRAYAIAHNQTQANSTMDDNVVMDEFDRIGLERAQYDAVGYTQDDIVFMQLDRQSAASAEDETGSEGRSAGFAARSAVTTDMVFSDQAEMLDWLTGLDWLRDQYPQALTVADLMTHLVRDYGEGLKSGD